MKTSITISVFQLFIAAFVLISICALIIASIFGFRTMAIIFSILLVAIPIYNVITRINVQKENGTSSNLSETLFPEIWGEFRKSNKVLNFVIVWVIKGSMYGMMINSIIWNRTLGILFSVLHIIGCTYRMYISSKLLKNEEELNHGKQ